MHGSRLVKNSLYQSKANYIEFDKHKYKMKMSPMSSMKIFALLTTKTETENKFDRLSYPQH